MTVLQVLNDSPYNELTILNKVYDRHGEEMDYSYCPAVRVPTGWQLGDDITNSHGVTLYEEVCGFYYDKADGIHGLSGPMLVVYTPSDWVIYHDDELEGHTPIANGYVAALLRKNN